MHFLGEGESGYSSLINDKYLLLQDRNYGEDSGAGDPKSNMPMNGYFLGLSAHLTLTPDKFIESIYKTYIS